MNKRSVSVLIMCLGIAICLPSSANPTDDQIARAISGELPFAEHDASDVVRKKKKRWKKLCDVIVSKCLRAGALKVDGNLVIDGNLTVNDLLINHAVACTITGGLDGQALIGSTGSNPVFNFITSDSHHSVTFSPGSGSLGLEAVAFFGNVARVDQIYGNDATGLVGGAPFATITAALAAAGTYTTIYGDPVVVWVFPGVYSDTAYSPETFPLNISNNVSLVGIAAGARPDVGGVTIQQLSAAGTSTLITMGVDTLLANVSLQLSTTNNVALTGISIATGPATIDSIDLNVSAESGSANAYGIHGTGAATIEDSVITVSSTGTQATAGILVDTANAIMMSNSTIMVTNTGGSAVGAETNNASASFIANASSVSGTTSDISQLAGSIMLAGTTLAHSTANNGSFASAFSPTLLVWNSHTGTGTVLTGTNYMVPGTAAVSASNPANFGYIIPQQSIVRNLHVYAEEAPGTGRTTTFTLYKNGSVTSLTTSLSGTVTANNDPTHSVLCEAGDVLSMQLINPSSGTGSSLGNISVNVELY